MGKSNTELKLSDIEGFCNQASNILQGTEYKTNKEIIDGLFDGKKDLYSIIIRLRLIDSCYSTGMTKNSGGFDALAKAIHNKRDTLVNDLEGFLNGEEDAFDNGLLNFFFSKYGKKRATSLISKYAYFLTGHKFPIYDDLVSKAYNLILPSIKKEVSVQEEISSNDKTAIRKYFISIRSLKNACGKLGRASYDELDQFLWLLGKLLSGDMKVINGVDDFKKSLEVKGLILPDMENKQSMQDSRLQRVRNHINKALKEIKGIQDPLLSGKVAQLEHDLRVLMHK